MEIQSKTFSEQHINSDSVITFPKGIPGFERCTQFKLYNQQDSEIVYLLQSIEDEDIGFSVAHPSHFNINYNFMLSDEEEQLLDVKSADDLLLLLILHRDLEAQPDDRPSIKGSINAPLLINTQNRIGMQKNLNSVEQTIILTEKHNEIDLCEK
jgi:flagellar assembly factor FliW